MSVLILAGYVAKALCIAYLLYRWWMRFVLIQRQASSRDIVVSLFTNSLFGWGYLKEADFVCSLAQSLPAVYCS